MTREEIVEEMKRDFRGEGVGKPRKYVGGLLPSFCDFLIELEAPGGGTPRLMIYSTTFRKSRKVYRP